MLIILEHIQHLGSLTLSAEWIGVEGWWKKSGVGGGEGMKKGISM